MAKLKGQHLALLYAGYDLSGRSRSLDATIEYDDIDLSAFQDGAHNSGPALPKFMANAESFFDPALASSHESVCREPSSSWRSSARTRRWPSATQPWPARPTNSATR